MIFITSEKPLFKGYVNGIFEVNTSNGGVIKKINIGTSEKKQDDSKEYSSWFAVLSGKARKSNEEVPLKKGDFIEIYSFKQTNVSKKQDDGKWSNPFFNMAIMDYKLGGSNNIQKETSEENDENPF